MAKEIMTADGNKIIVDDEDYDRLSVFSIRLVRHKGKIVSVQVTAQIGRLLMNPPKHLVVDHINGNPLDNRKKNLQAVTFGANMQNRPKLYRKGFLSTSKYIGVQGFRKHRRPNSSDNCDYGCHWKENGIHYAKYFSREIDAALYHDMKVLEIHGSKAKTNFLRTRDRPT